MSRFWVGPWLLSSVGEATSASYCGTYHFGDQPDARFQLKHLMINLLRTP